MAQLFAEFKIISITNFDSKQNNNNTRRLRCSTPFGNNKSPPPPLVLSFIVGETADAGYHNESSSSSAKERLSELTLFAIRSSSFEQQVQSSIGPQRRRTCSRKFILAWLKSSLCRSVSRIKNNVIDI